MVQLSWQAFVFWVFQTGFQINHSPGSLFPILRCHHIHNSLIHHAFASVPRYPPLVAMSRIINSTSGDTRSTLQGFLSYD
ncbi:hypothetical protein EV702DRAFT_632883 [Suillus placidus]|uniref:Uncharacterized protein n=1 Tax=Suillus placidus TaxID=48579 RepID=A0A9P7CXY9_9AGAM|nr:hypothetical protein EV702DRAFT_632883 [Suillus placidus]